MTPRPNARLTKIPEMTIRRLSVYTRCLLQLEEDGVKTVSSQELADRFNLNSAQVRKDLAYFGEFGVRGIGYYVSGLKAELQRILGLDREWPVALIGFGNLGSALFHYRGFARQGFRIAAIFDEDPTKVAPEVESTPIFASRDLGREVKARGIQIAIVAVPSEAAQAVADQLVAAGIKAILNFAPARIKVPRDVRLKHVDLSIELETLSFYLAKTWVPVNGPAGGGGGVGEGSRDHAARVRCSTRLGSIPAHNVRRRSPGTGRWDPSPTPPPPPAGPPLSA